MYGNPGDLIMIRVLSRRASRGLSLAASSNMINGRLLIICLILLFDVGCAGSVNEKNVLGSALEPCCMDPVTGFYRDGWVEIISDVITRW